MSEESRESSRISTLMLTQWAVADAVQGIVLAVDSPVSNLPDHEHWSATEAQLSKLLKAAKVAAGES